MNKKLNRIYMIEEYNDDYWGESIWFVVSKNKKRAIEIIWEDLYYKDKDFLFIEIVGFTPLKEQVLY